MTVGLPGKITKFYLVSRSGASSLAYWALLKVTKKAKCFEYGPGTVFTTLHFLFTYI